MHAIVLCNPAKIRSKNTARYSYFYLYRYEHSDDQKSPVSFYTNIFICTDTNNQMIKNHPRIYITEKIIRKFRPMFTSFCIQYHTNIHKKIHPYALV